MIVGFPSGCLISWRQPSERHAIQEVCSDLQDINLASWNGPNGYKPGNPFAYGCCVHRVQRVSAAFLCVFRWINLVRCLRVDPFFEVCVSLRSENLMISNAELESYLTLSLQWNLVLLLENSIYLVWNSSFSQPREFSLWRSRLWQNTRKYQRVTARTHYLFVCNWIERSKMKKSQNKIDIIAVFGI
jgi:hypothetical protein